MLEKNLALKTHVNGLRHKEYETKNFESWVDIRMSNLLCPNFSQLSAHVT